MIPIKEITTNEEFIESRRINYGKPYNEEEAAYHMACAERQAIENSSLYQRSIRAGFPASVAYERCKATAQRIDQAKEAA